MVKRGRQGLLAGVVFVLLGAAVLGSAHAAPSLSGISPGSGSSLGGTSVMINGAGFVLTGTTRVTFGGQDASGVAVTGTSTITCTTPPHAAGTVDVAVVNPDSQTGTLPAAFSYEASPAPTVNSFFGAMSGPSLGGTESLLIGTGFGAPGTLRVTLDGVDAHIVMAQSTAIDFITPPHAAGAVDVVVINPDGQRTTAPNKFTYTASPLPTVSAVSPNKGVSTGGTAVTVSGAGFGSLGVTRVQFDGIDANSVVVTGTGTITCVTPAHVVGTVDVTVINPDGQSRTRTSAFAYTAPPPPSLSAVSPSAGVSLGGTAVTISGSNFNTVGTTWVLFGGTYADSVVVTGTGSITCITPPHTAGAVDVKVINPDGQSRTRASAFTYTASPLPGPSMVLPDNGPSPGGTAVTIGGSGFSALGTTRVLFGETAAGSVVVTNPQSVTCVTPVHTMGAVDVRVVNPDGQVGTLANGFTYTPGPQPVPGTISPAEGLTVGCAVVTIQGSGFAPVGTTRVLFDGVDAGNVNVTGTGTIHCLTPPHANGAVDVQVINYDGQSGTLAHAFTYKPYLASELYPASGPVAGGALVGVGGAGFAPTGMRVLFGSVEVTELDSKPELLLCTLPAHAAGVVDVTVMDADGFSTTFPGAFTYRVPGEMIARVDADNTSGVEDGNTWVTAFSTIQSGVDAVVASGRTGEVWVADGTYTAAATGTVVVAMAPFCDLYGGFAGGETRRDQRDVDAHVCYIDGLDESACVYGADNARLDGFTITGGRGPLRYGRDGALSQAYYTINASLGLIPTPDAAVDNSGASLTMVNCTLTDNPAVFVVGNAPESASFSLPVFSGCDFANDNSSIGIMNAALSGTTLMASIADCTFAGNSAVAEFCVGGKCRSTLKRCLFHSTVGAGFMADSAGRCTTRVENCAFSGQTGGTVLLYTSASTGSVAPAFSNCTFTGNLGTKGVFNYAGLSSLSTAASLYNCIVWNNAVLKSGYGSLSLTASYSDIQGGLAGTGNIDTDPLFANAANGDYRLRAGSPCIDSGSADGAPETDLVGMPRPQGAGFDMGAMEMLVSTMPDLSGLARAAAVEWVTSARLYVRDESEEYHLTIPNDHVIRHTPPASASVVSGSPVDLVLSKGPQPVAVPNVVGQTQAAASEAITDATLAVGTVTEQYSLTVPSGTVISQTPYAGTQMLPGAAVDLVVSKGGIAVPNVAGTTQSVATTAITGAQLVVGTVTQQYSLTVASGSVISQTPSAGTQVLPGAAVDLVVSKGGIAVPNVAGTAQSAATTTITGALLAVGTVTEQYSLTVPSGTVISQTPSAGTQMLPGAAVDLVVSKGGIAVPNVAGTTQGAATTAITGAQLVVGTVTQQYSVTVASGSVISQTPASGTQVLPGAAINLVVSKGGIAVPALTGKTQAAAATALTGAQLVVGAVTEQHSASVPAGSVISQRPVAGMAVLPGTAVDLVVSTGAAPVAVPDVAGKTQMQAQAALLAAGLTLGTTSRVYSATVPAGSVISQDPAAGTEVPSGSAVTLVVSLGPEPPDADSAREALSNAFDVADTNGDGTLSFNESAAAVAGLTQAVFDELDSNADGQLSAAELGVDDGGGCAGCNGGKSTVPPGKGLGDLFLTGLGLLGLAAMAAVRRP